MKETIAYRGEFIVIECPYCHEETFLDIADDIGEGHISENGRKMTCPKCHKIMLVLPLEW